MILFTSGFPQAGKTELSRRIVSKIDNVIHVDPKEFYLKEYGKLPDEVKSAIAISAWEMAIEQVYDLMADKSNDTLIIFDTCCSNENAMRALFTNAKYNGHDIAIVFVDSPQHDRQERSPDTDLSQFESKYKSGFIYALPILKKLSGQFIRVINKNEGGFKELDKCAAVIIRDLKKIRNG
jgi:tRNA uridine 5-carbamoylmethylation protein Kti12